MLNLKRIYLYVSLRAITIIGGWIQGKKELPTCSKKIGISISTYWFLPCLDNVDDVRSTVVVVGKQEKRRKKKQRRNFLAKNTWTRFHIKKLILYSTIAPKQVSFIWLYRQKIYISFSYISMCMSGGSTTWNTIFCHCYYYNSSLFDFYVCVDERKDYDILFLKIDRGKK